MKKVIAKLLSFALLMTTLCIPVFANASDTTSMTHPDKEIVLSSIKSQLKMQGKEEWYEFFKQMIDEDYASLENRDPGFYHPDGGTLTYNVDTSTYVDVARSFVPIWRCPEIISSMQRSTEVGGFVEGLSGIFGPVPFTISSFILGNMFSLKWQFEDAYANGQNSVMIISTMDSTGNGATVATVWNSPYMTYSSYARNLAIWDMNGNLIHREN